LYPSFRKPLNKFVQDCVRILTGECSQKLENNLEIQTGQIGIHTLLFCLPYQWEKNLS